MSLSARELQPELMDDPGLAPAEHRRALAGLARLNAWSRSAAILWPTIRDLAKASGNQPVRVLDVATGCGDVPINLWRRASRARLAVEIQGCDLSPLAIAEAQRRAQEAGATVDFFLHDVVREPLPRDFDIITCSLFLHHQTNADAQVLLAALARHTGHTLLINDLARGALNFVLVWLASHVLTRSRVVWYDGQQSVRAAFTPGEALALAEQAGLAGAKVVRRWPCRFLLTWRRGS
jgi:2-polyprenyl-3-methyl-5-hydroxy-6-metoxy-1,4-benzoquinol methylase